MCVYPETINDKLIETVIKSVVSSEYSLDNCKAFAKICQTSNEFRLRCINTEKDLFIRCKNRLQVYYNIKKLCYNVRYFLENYYSIGTQSAMSAIMYLFNPETLNFENTEPLPNGGIVPPIAIRLQALITNSGGCDFPL